MLTLLWTPKANIELVHRVVHQLNVEVGVGHASLVDKGSQLVPLNREVRARVAHNFITSVCIRRLAGELYWVPQEGK